MPDYFAADPKHARWMASRLKDLDRVIAMCHSRGVVVQAGGHLGFWPVILASNFRQVITFEADPVNIPHLIENTKALANVTVVGSALWSSQTQLAVKHNPRDTSRSQVSLGSGPTAVTIDGMALPDCDLICLDVEGAEMEALKGARDTLSRSHPVVLLEGHKRRQEYEQYLSLFGYRFSCRIGADVLFVHRR